MERYKRKFDENIKKGDKVLYAIKTGSGIKTKKAVVTDIKNNKIYLDSSAILDMGDKVDSEKQIKMHHDFIIVT